MSKQTKPSEIQQRIDLSSVDLEEETPVNLQQAYRLEQDASLQPLAAIPENEPETPVPNARKKRFSLWFIGAVGVLSVTEFALYLWESWQASDVLALAWLACLGILTVAAGGAFIREWRSLGRLKTVEHLKQDINSAFHGPGIGLAEALTQSTLKLLPASQQATEAVFKQALQPHYNDREVLTLFEQKVIAPIDEQVMAIVSRHASASAVMIAASPFALLDMAIVLWRNFNMLGEISRAYGMNLSYWGKVRLIKSVFRSMLIAGASELAADAGNYMLTSGVTGKLSTRIAQGLGVGVMTARIGLKAADACRPIPWLALKKPGVQQLSQHTLEQLKMLVKR